MRLTLNQQSTFSQHLNNNHMSDISSATEDEKEKGPIFNSEELRVLYKRREAYRAKETTREERKKIVQKCCKGIKPFNTNLTEREWKARKKVSVDSDMLSGRLTLCV